MILKASFVFAWLLMAGAATAALVVVAVSERRDRLSAYRWEQTTRRRIDR